MNSNTAAVALCFAILVAAGAAAAQASPPPEDAFDAVGAGLDWLAEQQDDDGSWPLIDRKGICWKNAAVGVTGQALRAFLGNGHTHKYSPRPEYRHAVRNALEYIQATQAEDGSYGYRRGRRNSILNHAWATAAMGEAYAVSRDDTLKESLQAAARFIVDGQELAESSDGHRFRLGWSQDPGRARPDTLTTTLMLAALKACREAGIDLAELGLDHEADYDDVFGGALRWYTAMYDAESGGTAQAKRGGPAWALPCGGKPRRGDASATAPLSTVMGLWGRTVCGQKPPREHLRAWTQVVSAWPDVAASAAEDHAVHALYDYFAFQALFSMGAGSDNPWIAATLGAVRDRQVRDGDDAGSWDPTDPWTREGGRAFATALALTTLEIDYRFLPEGDASGGD